MSITYRRSHDADCGRLRRREACARAAEAPRAVQADRTPCTSCTARCTRHAAVDAPGGLFKGSIVTSRLVSDAHLAALAIEHGLTLCSTDGNFAKFPGLAWENPLAATA